MARPQAEGRMIRKDISDSDRYASLTPEAAVLFAMLIPHYNAHGKMNGGPGYIKDEVCPKVAYLTYENIPNLLQEISDKTNVKWFCNNKRWWLHSLNFLKEHQKLDSERKGPDRLPDYSATSPRLVGPEVEVEVKEEVQKECEPVAREDDSESQKLKDQNPTRQAEMPPEQAMPCTAKHAWETLLGKYPKPLGIIEGQASAEPIFLGNRAEWPRWIRNVEHYVVAKKGSRYVHALDNWLRVAYRDYDAPPKPLGENGKPPPQELAEKLQTEQYKPPLSPEAEVLFQQHNIPWPDLRMKVRAGEVKV